MDGIKNALLVVSRDKDRWYSLYLF